MVIRVAGDIPRREQHVDVGRLRAARRHEHQKRVDFTDALRERRNADLARILTEVGPDRAGAQRAFAAINRSVRAKDITSDVASKLMNAAVRGGGQVELGGLAGLPAR